jgi:tRNA/rRNA methyltransferase
MVRPVVVCHQLRSPENLGAIARVMANFGLTQLILSDPVTHDFRGVEKLGVKAEPVLERFAVAQTLGEALADVVYAVGTTSRKTLKRRRVLSPEEGVARLSEHAARGKVALVLGGEKRGLSDEELAQCHEVLAIPTVEAQPSMNVAQAAAVLLYLCVRPDVPTAGPEEPGADGALMARLEEKLKATLLACEFLNPQAPQHVLKELSRSLVRGRLTQREGQLWLGAFEHLLRAAGGRQRP